MAVRIGLHGLVSEVASRLNELRAELLLAQRQAPRIEEASAEHWTRGAEPQAALDDFTFPLRPWDLDRRAIAGTIDRLSRATPALTDRHRWRAELAALGAPASMTRMEFQGSRVGIARIDERELDPEGRGEDLSEVVLREELEDAASFQLEEDGLVRWALRIERSLLDRPDRRLERVEETRAREDHLPRLLSDLERVLAALVGDPTREDEPACTLPSDLLDVLLAHRHTGLIEDANDALQRCGARRRVGPWRVALAFQRSIDGQRQDALRHRGSRRELSAQDVIGLAL